MMAYTKKTWVTGEYFNADDMNHVENGIYDNAVTQTSVSNGVASFMNAAGAELFSVELPSSPLTNLLPNGDFHDGTNGWSAISPNHSSISVANGWLVLTHTATSTRAYGVSVSVATVVGHAYLFVCTLKKTMSDSDADSLVVNVQFGSGATAPLYLSRYTGVTQDTTLNIVGAGRAIENNSVIHIRFGGSIATAASNESMMELHDVRLYDITDIIPA